MIRPVAALTMLLLLTGCSNEVLTLVSADKVAAFQPGKTNESEVIGSLGQPSETMQEADGTKISQYPYRGGASSSGFMPRFMSSKPDAFGMVSFSYGANGVLKSIGGVESSK